MRVAMGSSNPDLQMKAVEYLAVSGDKKDSATFTNIYRSTSDPSVKRAALQALFMRKDENALVTLARSETNEELRRKLPASRRHASGRTACFALFE